MINPDALQAFVLAAELGSFSAAARRMGKAQSAVSASIANLEIDAGVDLFDRSARNPVLTEQGEALLPHALGILLGNREFMAKASSMVEGVETELCLAVELGISMRPLIGTLEGFAANFPHVSLEILMPSPIDTADLLKQGRADIGIMVEQESYPQGFQFRGVGYSRLVPVCARDHPLATGVPLGYRDLRRHRQILSHSRSNAASTPKGEIKSASIWRSESPAAIVDLVLAGFGWAELPYSAVSEQIDAGTLVPLTYAFQQSDILEGVDVVWTERRALGLSGRWIRDEFLKLPEAVWRDG